MSGVDVSRCAACGRTRWKIENETFNVLKNQGYHLEHTFGHGKETLPSVLVVLNLLAFALHTGCDLIQSAWQAARDRFRARTRMFIHLPTITEDHVFPFVFPFWAALMRTRRISTAPQTSTAHQPPRLYGFFRKDTDSPSLGSPLP